MVAKIDFDNECNATRWGTHPEYSYYTRDYGQIIKVHDDGSVDVKIKKVLSYEDEKIIRNIKLFHIDPWEEKRREYIINSRKRKLQVGAWVEVMEQRNLFYIYTWEKRFRYGEFKMVFKSGKPHLGPRKRFLIERVWTSEKDMNHERFHY